MSSDAVAAVVLAGGQGRRSGASINKVLLELAGVPILVRAIAPFLQHELIARVLVVAHQEDLTTIGDLVGESFPAHSVEVIAGGAQRPDSERCALEVLRADIDSGAISAVLIHDGARPLVPSALIEQIVNATLDYGGAIPGVGVHALVHRGSLRQLDGAAVRVQTPQGFRAPQLLAAYDAAMEDNFEGTDTSSYVEAYGTLQVRVVPGSADNIKLTWPADVSRAEQALFRLESPGDLR